jgi:hypothetical protein
MKNFKTQLLLLICCINFYFLTMQNLKEKNLNAIGSLSQNKEIYNFIKNIQEKNDITVINKNYLEEKIETVKNLIISIGFINDNETKSDIFKVLVYIYKFFSIIKKTIELAIVKQNYNFVILKNKELNEKADAALKLNETIKYWAENHIKIENLDSIKISLMNKKNNFLKNIDIIKNQSYKDFNYKYEKNSSIYFKLKNTIDQIKEFLKNMNYKFLSIKNNLILAIKS